jgi:hypothetical protein
VLSLHSLAVSGSTPGWARDAQPAIDSPK